MNLSFKHRVCLGVSIAKDHEPQGILVSLSRDGEVTFDRAFHSFAGIREYIVANSTVPISIRLDFEEILYVKHAEDITSDDQAMELLTNEAPNRATSSFCVSYFSRLLAFAEKDSVLQMLEPFSDFMNQVVSVTLGATTSLPMALVRARDNPLVEDLGSDRFSFQGANHFSHESIDAASFKDGLLEVPSTKTDAFFSALNFLLGTTKTLGIEDFEERKTQLLYGKLFQLARIPVLALLFVSFLISAVIFTLNDADSLELEEQSRLLQQLSKERTALLSFLHEKKHLIDRSEEVSQLADLLGSTVPRDIQLTDLVIFTKSEDRRSGVDFHRDKILVKGNTFDLSSFARWIKQVEGLDAVNSIAAQKVTKNKENKRLSDFEFLIQRDVQ
ncbi:MAG: hypothetical protein AAF789_06735 [Bacteroidota bacterium]